MTEAGETFYTTIAQVSAGLFALMFAAIQFRPAHWRRDPLKRLSAVVALTELLVPTLVGLGALVPGHKVYLASFVGGLLGFVSILWFWYAYFATTSSKRTPYDRTQAALCLVSLGVYVSLIFAGSANFTGSMPEVADPWLVASWIALVWLPFSGSTEIIWLLMFDEASVDEQLQTTRRAGSRTHYRATLTREVMNSRISVDRGSPIGNLEAGLRS